MIKIMVNAKSVEVRLAAQRAVTSMITNTIFEAETIIKRLKKLWTKESQKELISSLVDDTPNVNTQSSIYGDLNSISSSMTTSASGKLKSSSSKERTTPKRRSSVTREMEDINEEVKNPVPKNSSKKRQSIHEDLDLSVFNDKNGTIIEENGEMDTIEEINTTDLVEKSSNSRQSIRTRTSNSKNYDSKTHTHLSKLHGISLGFSAVIQSSPYTVPKWLPPLILYLNPFAYSQHQIIKSSIRKSISEFKKTHTVAWQEHHKPKFNQEELEALNDMSVMHSYFT